MAILNPNNLPEEELSKKLADMDRWARETELKGFPFRDGNVYHMHDVEFNRLVILSIAAYLGLFEWPADFNYWDDYGNLVPLTQEQALDLGLAGANAFHAMKQRKRLVQQQLMQAKTEEELEAIKFSSDRFDKPPSEPDWRPLERAYTSLQLFALFTPEEEEAIEVAGETDPKIRIFLRWATAANNIKMSDVRIASGLDYLEAKGLLTAARKADVLAGRPAPGGQ